MPATSSKGRVVAVQVQRALTKTHHMRNRANSSREETGIMRTRSIDGSVRIGTARNGAGLDDARVGCPGNRPGPRLGPHGMKTCLWPEGRRRFLPADCLDTSSRRSLTRSRRPVRTRSVRIFSYTAGVMSDVDGRMLRSIRSFEAGLAL